MATTTGGGKFLKLNEGGARISKKSSPGVRKTLVLLQGVLPGETCERSGRTGDSPLGKRDAEG